MKDVVGELGKEGMINELLYAGDLVIMKETIDTLREMFRKLKVLESKGLKVNI